MRRCVIAGTFVLLLCGAPGAGALAASGSVEVWPLVAPDGLRDEEIRLRHVAPSRLELGRGTIRVEWPRDLEVLAAFVVADWNVVSPYVEGTATAIEPVSRAKRQDLVARLRDRHSGEEFLGLTPLWCSIAGSRVRAPEQGCYAGNETLGCQVSDQADGCVNVSVTCAGDSGTCSSCGSAMVACCQSTQSRTETLPTGAKVTYTTHVQRRMECPIEEQPAGVAWD